VPSGFVPVIVVTKNLRNTGHVPSGVTPSTPVFAGVWYTTLPFRQA
jgi:hypothetical protein